jgi:hypothetical protein
MPITYESIATTTLGSAAASHTFSSIPATYTDLVLVINNIFSTTSSPYIVLQFNSDTTSNYSSTILEGSGSAASSNRWTSQTEMYMGYNVASGTTSIGMALINIFNYANTTTFKTVLARINNLNSSFPGTGATVGLWKKSPEAINSVKVFQNAGNLPSGTVLTLYGVKAA